MNRDPKKNPAQAVLFVFILLVQLSSAQMQRIAIAPLQGSVAADELELLTQRLTEEVVALNSFEVIERAQLERVLQEQGLQQSGVVSPQSAVELGQVLGAQRLLVGKANSLGARYSISLRLIDTQNGKILSAITLEQSPTFDYLLNSALGDAVAVVCGQMSREALMPAISSQLHKGRILKTIGLVTLGVGTLSAASGLLWYLEGSRRYDAYFNAQSGNVQSMREEYKSAYRFSRISLITAAVTLPVSGFMLLKGNKIYSGRDKIIIALGYDNAGVAFSLGIGL